MNNMERINRNRIEMGLEVGAIEVVSEEKKGNKIKSLIVGGACAVFLSVSVFWAGFSGQIDEEYIEYQRVFISYENGDYKTASDAIVKLNSGVDYRELLPFFEERNDVASSGNIVEGFYDVPIYVKE